MRRRLYTILCGVLWFAAIGVGMLDLVCAGLWWRLHRYVEVNGAAENPYAAEDAFLLGLFALFLLIVFLCLLAAALGWSKFRRKKLVRPKDENTTAE